MMISLYRGIQLNFMIKCYSCGEYLEIANPHTHQIKEKESDPDVLEMKPCRGCIKKLALGKTEEALKKAGVII